MPAVDAAEPVLLTAGVVAAVALVGLGVLVPVDDVVDMLDVDDDVVVEVGDGLWQESVPTTVVAAVAACDDGWTAACVLVCARVVVARTDDVVDAAAVRCVVAVRVAVAAVVRECDVMSMPNRRVVRVHRRHACM